MRRFKFVLVSIVIFLLTNSWAIGATKKPFVIYAYLPWNTNTDKKYQEQVSYLSTYGIKPISIIYENNYFTHQEVDFEKIKKVALNTLANPTVPVSFDMEFGNRFKPQTVIPRIEKVLNHFYKFNAKSLVGIYATIPQNNYGKVVNNFSYERLNNPYRNLISQVDFISPSLYNYDNHNFKNWSDNTIFVMKLATEVALSKPIIPYISPIIRLGMFSGVKNGSLVDVLTEAEMKKRLTLLYQQGASGCIIWVSSQDRLVNGQIPQFYPNQGWGKAVVDFIKSH